MDYLEGEGRIAQHRQDPQPERKRGSLGASLAWTPSDAFAAQLT